MFLGNIERGLYQRQPIKILIGSLTSFWNKRK